MSDAGKWVPLADLEKSHSRVMQPDGPVALPFVRLDEDQPRDGRIQYVIVDGMAYPVTCSAPVEPRSHPGRDRR